MSLLKTGPPWFGLDAPILHPKWRILEPVGGKKKHHGTVTPSAEGKAALVGGRESNLRT